MWKGSREGKRKAPEVRGGGRKGRANRGWLWKSILWDMTTGWDLGALDLEKRPGRCSIHEGMTGQCLRVNWGVGPSGAHC